jgi:hypothetical protein
MNKLEKFEKIGNPPYRTRTVSKKDEEGRPETKFSNKPKKKVRE